VIFFQFHGKREAVFEKSKNQNEKVLEPGESRCFE
jgi:hypothetical protein